MFYYFYIFILHYIFIFYKYTFNCLHFDCYGYCISLLYIIPNIYDRISDGADYIKPRQKRCGDSESDTTTTARNINWDFEHPSKDGDPVDPIDKDYKLLPQKRNIQNERSRDGQAFFKEILSSLLNIVRHTPRLGSIIFRERRSADEDDNKPKSHDKETASLQ